MTHPPSVEDSADVQDVHAEAPVDVDPVFHDVEPVFADSGHQYVAHLSEMYGHHESLTPKQLPPGELWNFQRITAGVLLILASALFLVVVFQATHIYAQLIAAVACLGTSLVTFHLLRREARLRREAIREREEFA